MLIVDDSSVFRAVARMILEDAGHVVLGEAADGASAFEAALSLRPDVILLDVHLPDLDGFAVARRITARNQAAAVVLMSACPASDFSDRARACRARGFIAKERLSGAAIAAVL